MSIWQPTTPYPDDFKRVKKDIDALEHLHILQTIPHKDNAAAVREILRASQQTETDQGLERRGNSEIWMHARERVAWATMWLREIGEFDE